MLNNLLDSWFQFDVGEGAFYSILCFLFVFVGILILITVITIIGKIITTANKVKEKRTVKNVEEKPQILQNEGELSPEIVAVISAAIASYYQTQQTKCDFVVRRIKRI